MPTNQTKMGEMLNKRTKNSKTWINFDGSYTTEIHGGDIHFADEDGNLHNINTDLFDEADFDVIDEPVANEGAFDFKVAKRTVEGLKKDNQLNRDTWDFQALKVPFDAKIPRLFRRGYSIGKGKEKLTFKPVGASPSDGYVEGNKITYPDAWTDTDVTLEVTPNGIKEYITLKSPDAPIDFSFEVTGNVEQELKLHDAWLADAEGTERDVMQSVASREGKTYVDLVADTNELSYPIVIDPTVTVKQTTKENLIRSNLSSGNYPSPDSLEVGLHDTGAARRSLLQLDVSDIPSEAVILEASLDLYFYIARSGFGYDVSAHEITSAWDSAVTWDTQPTINPTTEDTLELRAAYGTVSFNLKNLVSRWVNGTENNGIMLVGEDINGSLKEFYSSTSTNDYPKLEITYNSPPTKPTLTIPNGGESWNTQHAVTWNASFDADNDSITYQAQLSTDNGSTYSTIFNGVTGNSYEYDFSNESETSTALIRIRSYDGTSYSDWDTSDGVFTIDHNNAPSQPSNLSPSNGIPKDQNESVRFEWQHNDSAGDNQSKYDLQWRVQGNSTWNTISNVTPNNYYDAPAGLFPQGDIEWRIRTYDQENVASPYSSTVVFYIGNRPSKPSFTYPGGEDVPVSNPTIQWSSSGQSTYDLRVFYNDIFSDYEQVYQYTGGTNKAHTIQYDLDNQTRYELRLSITDSDGLTSEDAVMNFFVSYTQPPKSPVTLIENDASGTMRIEVDFPEPTGTEPGVSSYDVYRREDDEPWMRVAKDLAPDVYFIDFTPGSEKTYDYYVRVWGDNNTYEDTDILTGSIKLDNAILSLMSDANQYVELDKVTGTSLDSGVDRTVLQFAGRRTPVSYFGQTDSWSLETSFLIKGNAAMNQLRKIANSREVLLYRDERGRRAFVTLAGVKEQDVIGNDYYQVSLSPIETYYNEEV